MLQNLGPLLILGDLIFSQESDKIKGQEGVTPTNTIKLKGAVDMKGQTADDKKLFMEDLKAKLAEANNKAKARKAPAKKSGKKPSNTATTSKGIDPDIQAKVDEYIEIDAQAKKLLAELKVLRGDIEPYMEDENLTVIAGTTRGSISLQPKEIPLTNARYTTYDLDGVLSVIDPRVRREVVVKRVDRDALDLMIKTGRVPKEVEQFRVYHSTHAFTISHK